MSLGERLATAFEKVTASAREFFARWQEAEVFLEEGTQALAEAETALAEAEITLSEAETEYAEAEVVSGEQADLAAAAYSGIEMLRAAQAAREPAPGDFIELESLLSLMKPASTSAEKTRVALAEYEDFFFSLAALQDEVASLLESHSEEDLLLALDLSQGLSPAGQALVEAAIEDFSYPEPEPEPRPETVEEMLNLVDDTVALRQLVEEGHIKPKIFRELAAEIEGKLDAQAGQLPGWAEIEADTRDLLSNLRRFVAGGQGQDGFWIDFQEISVYDFYHGAEWEAAGREAEGARLRGIFAREIEAQAFMAEIGAPVFSLVKRGDGTWEVWESGSD